MRDRLPYAESFGLPTFSQWCQRNGVTPDERDQLFTYLLSLRLLRMLRGN